MSISKNKIFDRISLKNFFKNGTIPNEKHFSFLIDSMTNKQDDGINKDAENGLILSTTGKSKKILTVYKKIDDLDSLRKWLRVLVAPGASLGGARPKANFTEGDGSLWIAKFPAKDDDRDIGAWEMLAHHLATRANIQMPEAKLLKLGNPYRTFAVKRFDRGYGQRMHYASAMTMLKQESSDDASYLDIAQFIMTRGARGSVKEDLAQLFRRVVFNVAISNRDDHLRNHGFILGPSGWRLSPAFDLNPNIDKAEHALNLDVNDNRPQVDGLISTAAYYELTHDQAKQIIREVFVVVSTWEAVASSLKITRAEIELMRSAFLS
jgi:serine/threonine-protein kinase HipA